MWRAFVNEAPQVDAASLEREAHYLTAFALVSLMWGPHLSLLSTWTPKTFISDSGLPLKPGILILAVMLNLFGLLVKWMRWYLSGEKADPWVAAQCSQILFASSRVPQFYSVDLLKVRMLVLSTKPRGNVLPLLSLVRRLDAK